MDAKYWLQSKTVIFNLLVFVVALLAFVLTSHTGGQLPFAIDAKWVAFGIAAINFLLRWFTDSPITTKVNWNS